MSDGFPPRSDLSSAHSRLRPTPYVSPSIHPDPTTDSAALSSKLTPLRKHYKLSKDGSGNEVWPEFVEKIFVEGLRAYCSSGFSLDHSSKTSESSPKCRSRLRNTFLVQHLARHGINRSRKQVASHLQVLKNMWKVDENSSTYYNLIAGLDTLPTAEVTSADHRPSRNPSPAFSCTSSTSSSNPSVMGSPALWPVTLISSSSSPYSSPSSSTHSSPLGIQQSIEMSYATERNQTIIGQNQHQPVVVSIPATRTGLSIAGNPGAEVPSAELNAKQISTIYHQEPPTHRQQPDQQQLDKLAVSSSIAAYASGLQRASVGGTTAVSQREPQTRRQQQQLHTSAPVSSSSYHVGPASASERGATYMDLETIPNRNIPTLTNLYLLTDGMLPLEVNLLDPDNVGVAYLCLELDVPLPQASPPSSFPGYSDGFGVQLEAYCPSHPIGTRWTLPLAFQCVTQVWGINSSLNDYHRSLSTIRKPPTYQETSSQTPLSLLGREQGIVQVTEVPGDNYMMGSKQQIILIFPESPLSTCRRLEKGATMINQELTVDGHVILRLTYMLNRPVELPAARLLEWRHLSTSSTSHRTNQPTPRSYTDARTRIHTRPDRSGNPHYRQCPTSEDTSYPLPFHEASTHSVFSVYHAEY